MSRYGFGDDELTLPPPGTVLEDSDGEVLVRSVLHLVAVDADDDLAGRRHVDGDAVRAYSRSMHDHAEQVAVAVDALLARGWRVFGPDGDEEAIATAVIAERCAQPSLLAADLEGLGGEPTEIAAADLAVVYLDASAEEDDDAEASVPLLLEEGRLVVGVADDSADFPSAWFGGGDGDGNGSH